MNGSCSDRLDSALESNDSTCSTCRACGDHSIKKLPGASHPICTGCGFVDNADLQVPADVDDAESSTPSESDSWKTYSSVANSTEKQLVEAIDIIETLGEHLCLNAETRHHAAEVYTAAALVNLTDGRPTATVAAAAVTIGTREKDCPRPIEPISEPLSVGVDCIRQTVRLFQHELDRGCTALSPTSYLPYICKEIGIEDWEQSRATALIEQLEAQDRCTGKDPAGVAGAALYLTPDVDVTQREIATIAGVTKETIRVRVKEAREVMSDEP